MQTLAYALFLFAPNYFVLGAIGAIIFVAIPIFNVAVLSYRLALIPDKLQGRVDRSLPHGSIRLYPYWLVRRGLAA